MSAAVARWRGRPAWHLGPALAWLGGAGGFFRLAVFGGADRVVPSLFAMIACTERSATSLVGLVRAPRRARETGGG